VPITTLIGTFCALILTRITVEAWLLAFPSRSVVFYFFEFTHTFLFFYLLFIICVLLTSFFARISIRTCVHIFLFGFILIIFPPIIDTIIAGQILNDQTFYSYYLFDDIGGLLHSFLTFFGDRPHDGITYGTRFIIAIAIIFMGILTYVRTQKFFRSLTLIVTAYTIFFVMSALPSIITFIFTDAHFTASRAGVAAFIASPTSILNNPITDVLSTINIKMTLVYTLIATLVTFTLYLYFYRSQCLSLLRNIRPIQSMYHIGLFVIGIGIGVIFNNAIFLPSFFTILAFLVCCIAIIFAWYSTVVFNDIVDRKIDQISNPHRPLITQTISVPAYRTIGIALGFLSVTLIGMINIYAGLMLVYYHALSYLYNTPPLRLKRFPFIATFLAACASFLIVGIGYIIIVPNNFLTGFPVHIAVLLIVAYTISLPIKDIKDIHGDKKNQIYTIPVIFGEKHGRMIIGVGIFCSFMLSIITLNSMSLIIPGVVSGSLCYWILVGQKKKRFVFSPHLTVALVFTIVVLYGAILTSSLFF
jgi:4-hydroxybenzoate polyprenyltransferase